MLANLPKWTGDASNLSGLARQRNAAAEAGAWDSDPAAAAEVAFLDGGATETEPESITQPGERLRVYNLAGYGEPLLLSEVLISSRSMATEAAALAYMRLGPHDIRPNLLMLMQGQDLQQASKCHEYALNYLRAWCQRCSRGYSNSVLGTAATDGLAMFYRLREVGKPCDGSPPLATPSTKARAKSLRLRDDDYRRLRQVVLSALQDRYLEGVANFARALGQPAEAPVPSPCRRRKRETRGVNCQAKFRRSSSSRGAAIRDGHRNTHDQPSCRLDSSGRP